MLGRPLEGVRAIAASVRDATGEAVAAISITFIAGLDAPDSWLLRPLLQAGERATLALAGMTQPAVSRAPTTRG